MKMKNKGKVYPSPPSSSSSSSSSTCSNGAGGGGVDYLSVLQLLPAAIIVLASVLPLEDREVLAYLIMRSMKTTVSSSAAAATTTNRPSFYQKKPSKKSLNTSSSSSAPKAPGSGLYCDCFDCYTSFWFRWDSSPNRELIHQAIEAFEDHLTSGESEKSKKNGKGKRRDKTARRFAENDKQVVDVVSGLGRPETPIFEKQVQVIEESSGSTVFVAAAAAAALGCGVLPENVVAPKREADPYEDNEAADGSIGSSPTEELTEVVRSSTAVTSCSTHHKGLARKVLPDVLGLFNSRLWSLWSPNV